MQCVLLEAAGCASPAAASAGPDCIYIDQVKSSLKPAERVAFQRPVRCVLTSFLVFAHVKAKATLLQLEALESGIEERLNAPPAPCLSCADWFLPSAAPRDSLASSSPVFSKLTGAVKGGPDSGGRGLFGDRSRRFSPQRGLSDSGSEGQGDAGLGPTPESPRKPGGRRNSLGSDGSGGLFKVNVQIPGAAVHYWMCFELKDGFYIDSDTQDEAPKPLLPGHPEEDPDRQRDRGDV